MSTATITTRGVARGTRSSPGKPHAALQWLAPAGLIVLSLIPVLAGALRLTELAGGAEITASRGGSLFPLVCLSRSPACG